MTLRHVIDGLTQFAQLRQVASGCVRALTIGVASYFAIYLLERASGGSTGQYRSRGFLHDVVYWFYYRSGLNQLLFMAALFSFLGHKLNFFHLHFADGMHPIVRGTLWILIADFTSYWVHRLQHASRFVWAFHSTHHSQEQLNFATTTRFHPIDHFISDVIKFFPPLVLGASPMSWLPLYLTTDFMTMAQHSRIKWRFGVLSRILVTPRFHSFHHSADPRHYDKNFGGIFSVWDYMFGTALDAAEQPSEFGLSDVKMPTLVSTLVVPFRLLRRSYSKSSPQSSIESNRVA
jgi:sterol desaturase/sphingolipid hydroxylase (fatty acid hydroxylase superfamily)